MNLIPDESNPIRIGARPVRTMQLDGGILAAQVGSEPPAVIVLNGGQAFVSKTTSRRLRRDLLRVAGILPRDTPFVLLGYPDKPGTQYRIADIVEQVARGIATHWQCTTLIGISFGGVVAARLAAAHPERVSRLGLVSSAHRLAPERPPAHRAANHSYDPLRFRQSARNDVRMLPRELAQHAPARGVVQSTPPRRVIGQRTTRHCPHPARIA